MAEQSTSGSMQFSGLADRVSGEGADAWVIHSLAMERAQAGEDVIILSVGQEINETTSPPIVEAARASLSRGRHHYAPIEGEAALREAIVEAHAKRTSQCLSKDCCTVFAGAQNALFSTALCLLENGDEVILCEPYYTTYPATFSAGGAEVVRVVTSRESGFEPDPARLKAACSPRTRAIVVNFPNNPTGAICSRETMSAIVKLCVDQRIWLISDEVYADLVPAGSNCSPASVPGSGDICITVSSLSKSHRMTGWRLGWVLGPRALSEKLQALSLCLAYGLPPFVQDAAIAAFRLPSSATEAVRNTLDEKRRTVVRGLRNIPRTRVHEAPGGMFVLLDISELRLSTHDFAIGLLETHDVAVLPCAGFGRSTHGLVRISATESLDRLETACKRIATYVASLN